MTGSSVPCPGLQHRQGPVQGGGGLTAPELYRGGDCVVPEPEGETEPGQRPFGDCRDVSLGLLGPAPEQLQHGTLLVQRPAFLDGVAL